MKRVLRQDHKYLQVAEGIEQMIQSEVLCIGDKLPSVRVLSEEHGISLGTAFQAYYHLEGKGLIESRPKSGYYVRFNNRRFPGVPAASSTPPAVKEISTQEMITSVFGNLAGNELINLSMAAPQTELLPAAKLNKSVVHALRSARHHCLDYEDIQGNKDLRKQVARLCFNWGGKCAPEDIIITAGCMEALAMCLKGITTPGDTIAIESPTYFGFFGLIESLGLKAIEIPTDPIAGVDLQALEQAFRNFPVKACLFVPNFSNPLGSCMPDDRKQELVRLITHWQVPLIEDDIYGELYFGKHRPRTCKSFDRDGWVLHCSSLSKSLAPGYRIGWCIPGRFFNQVRAQKVMHTVTGTTLTQTAMAHFLGIGRYDYHLQKLRRALYTQYLRYVQGILEYFPSDVKISRPSGGYILWVELNKEVDAYKLYTEALKYGISIAPGQLFSATGAYRNCLRIGYGRFYDETTSYGLKVLGDLIKKQLKR